jgi:tetratricopeptide (TPR) repeat protein
MKITLSLFFFFCLLNGLFAQSATSTDDALLLDHYQNQRYAEASALLESRYGKDTADPKAMTQLAYANLMAGNLAQAETYYARLTALQPENIPVLYSLANVNLRRGNEAKAKEYYLRILKIDSNNFRVYKQLAGLIGNSASPEKLAFLTKANSLNPKEADVAFDLATGLNMLQENVRAYQVLEPAIEADTSNFVLLRAKLPVCIALLKYKEATYLGQKLLASGDSTTFVINSLGKIAFLQHAYPQAIAYYELLERRGEQSEASLYYTAASYEKLKNFTAAADYINRTITEGISPNISSYYTFLGSVLEEKQQFKGANRAYKRGLDYPHKADTYYRLGLLNDLNLKNKAAAVQYYKLYLKNTAADKEKEETLLYVRSRLKALN